VLRKSPSADQHDQYLKKLLDNLLSRREAPCPPDRQPERLSPVLRELGQTREIGADTSGG
jgi:hypothetical protein